MNGRWNYFLLIALAAFSTEAQAQNLFGGTGRLPYRDISGSPEIRDLRLDYDYIEQGRALHALAGSPTTEVRRNYVYVEDTDGSLTIPYRTGDDLFESFNFALGEVYNVLPHEFVFVYLFTSFETGVGAFFYQPEANNTRGIGELTYDMNGPNEPREGFVFMNDWGSFDGITGGGPQYDLDYARSVFNQEAGHRWASFITAGAGNNGTGADVLLGRDDSHWSYFLDTGGSPMEGNSWADLGSGRFRTNTGFDNYFYSPLDLYLMGLIPPDQVPGFYVISQPTIPMGAQDLYGQAISKASPPQVVDPVTVTGTRIDFTADEIINLMGTHSPMYPNAPNSFRVVFVMLAGRTSPLSEGQRTDFENIVDQYAAGFASGTGGRASLDFELVTGPKSPLGGACQRHRDCDGTGNSCLLIPPADPAVGLCTHACTDVSQCGDGFCCQPASSGAVVCLPNNVCQVIEPPDAGVPMMMNMCACDVTANACDMGCACDTTCMNGNGNVDGGTGNGNGNGNGDGTCACDVTYGCDTVDGRKDSDACSCDAECTGDSGGGCATTDGSADRTDRTGLFLLLGASLFFVSSKKKKK